MDFKQADNTMPQEIYEGYKFPQEYALYGKTDIANLNENNSHAVVYVGMRSEIDNLITMFNSRIEDYTSDDFIVVAKWDNHNEKNSDDYIMLATIISTTIEENPLDYMRLSNKIHQLTDSSTSDSDAWRAWGNVANDYMYNSVSPEETTKVANILLSNVSNDMLQQFKEHAADDFLKSLIPGSKKLKI